ncbi:MAG: adenylate/guanylate cyclase domain-containing protein, partial [Verrucomicrobiota bacterium]
AAATRPLQVVREGVLKIADGELDTRISGLAPDEFGQLGDAVNAMARSLQEREMLKEAFARYVSRDVAESIIESNQLPRLEGTRQKVTILFTDIRDFTAWAEDVPPEDVVSQLNEYFTKMVEIVFANKGGIDKFIGDGLMAVFGAPLQDEEQEYHAVKAMIEMEDAARALAANWYVKGKRALQIGMAVHTGTAVVGNIGSEQKMDYTAIGRTVNVAARLEAKTKEVKTCGIVSADTVEAVRDRFAFESIGSIQLRGVATELEIFTLPELRQSMDIFGASQPQA